MKKKIIGFLIAICLGSVFFRQPVFAKVLFEKTGAGEKESVYVAGNPDLYPIEYYDESTKTYKGIIPNLLNTVSEQTNIDFTYILSGKENAQKTLYKNKQAEILTSVIVNNHPFENLETVPVFTIETNGELLQYGIGFTSQISEDLKREITEAISNVTESQKAGFLVAEVNAGITRTNTRNVILCFLVVVVFFTLIFAFVIRFVRKKRKKEDINEKIDEVTGVGNADYYVYAFEQLISEQAKNLYALAYFSFDFQKTEKLQSSISCREIEQYAAVKFNQYVMSSEYLSRVSDGTFALLFQAENTDVAKKRVSEAVSGVNQYLRDCYTDYEVVFRAGYCRLCDYIGANAETAIYNAKQGYLYADRNNLSYHVGSKAEIAANKKTENLAAQINNALKQQEFHIYLQLIMDTKSARFCGAEVLSRWENKEYGLLHPAEYIDILSETGKIVEHDYYIFECACRQLEVWNQKTPLQSLFLTCNFTRISIAKEDFAKKLDTIAQKYQFERQKLIIEITEDIWNINSNVVSENVKCLHALGFQVAIDDMGSGFSSFADIYDNEIDIVKIEKNFIKTCVTDRRKQMLRDIITLIHNAGSKVICEGIETQEQQEILQNMNCDMMQGYYHARVLPVSECEKFIQY